MIGYLEGIAKEITAKEIIILTSSGVGYAIFPAGSLLSQAKQGQKTQAEILTVVKENEISLYGFGAKEEKQLFQKLIVISGIGPKTALQIISAPIKEIQKAIEEGNVGYLSKIPGLGKKTAERLIIEMRGKIDLSEENYFGETNIAHQEATAALINLGYDRHTIKTRLDAMEQTSSTEEFIKGFLASKIK